MTKLLTLLILITNLSFGQQNLELAIDLYNKRDVDAVGLKANPENINKAISILETIHTSATNETVVEYLMRSYYFKASFVELQEEQKKAIFFKAVDLGKKYINKYPNNPAIRYWYISNYGRWGELIGVMKAAKEGVADHLKEHCDALIKLDPKYNEAGGKRILGIMHYKVPYIPFVVSWPDNDEAEKLLKECIAIDPKDSQTNFYLGEFYLEDGNEDLAKKHFQNSVNFPLDPKYRLEQMEDQLKAKKYLNEEF